ncbi:MAG TPA: ABC transporter permease, partial [Candidatus Saccharimonadia bacterium]|nr:ABC transporter permease [Candidatus Saccharimonadia bacterium]
MKILLAAIILFIAIRLGRRLFGPQLAARSAAKSKKPLKPWQRKLYTVQAFYTVNLKRLFRDRTALFFTFLFPLIFLFVFGSFSKNTGTSFNVAVINQSKSPLAQQYVQEIKSTGKIFKLDKTDDTLAKAKDRMSKSQIDGIIIIPAGFGTSKPGQTHPSGQVQLLYSQNSTSTGQTLTTILQSTLKPLNARYINLQQPFSVSSEASNEKNLTAFDYTFTGLLGFAILGAGIFGPMNVFPELKKMGILLRLHTTPLRTWQYFMSVMIGNAVVGLLSLALML